MNSLYAPADSLKPILHIPTQVEEGLVPCANCGLEIQFNTYSRRWSSNAWNSIYCKDAK